MTRQNPLLIHFSFEFLKIKSLSKAGRSRIDSRNNRRIIKLQLSGISKGMFQNISQQVGRIVQKKLLHFDKKCMNVCRI